MYMLCSMVPRMMNRTTVTCKIPQSLVSIFHHHSSIGRYLLCLALSVCSADCLRFDCLCFCSCSNNWICSPPEIVSSALHHHHTGAKHTQEDDVRCLDQIGSRCCSLQCQHDHLDRRILRFERSNRLGSLHHMPVSSSTVDEQRQNGRYPSTKADSMSFRLNKSATFSNNRENCIHLLVSMPIS